MQIKSRLSSAFTSPSPADYPGHKDMTVFGEATSLDYWLTRDKGFNGVDGWVDGRVLDGWWIGGWMVNG